MRKFAPALVGAAFFALPTLAFSQTVVVGPGGVQIRAWLPPWPPLCSVYSWWRPM